MKKKLKQQKDIAKAKNNSNIRFVLSGSKYAGGGG